MGDTQGLISAAVHSPIASTKNAIAVRTKAHFTDCRTVSSNVRALGNKGLS